MRYFILLLLPTFLFLSCKSEDMDLEPAALSADLGKYPGVEAALWEYFEAFEEEAAKRGIEVDLSQGEIQARIVNIDPDHVAGTCTYNPDTPNRVRIDADFWKVSNSELREMVVFHELGHCQLIRDHREVTDDNGKCLSIMASGTESCQLLYNASTRTAYLDELFDEEFAGDWFN